LDTFESLGVHDSILPALKELGIVTPTEIQAKSIPHLRENGGDFLGLAQTGTGKTAAFALPLLELVDSKKRQTQALILSPTRELGQQIAKQIQLFGKHLPQISAQVVFGGQNIVIQMKALKRTPQILIATPGRLIDLIKRKAVDINNIRYLVLDEADEMLNMGFKQELDQILSHTSSEKAVWLFSATMPKDVRHIVKKFMSDNVHEVSVTTGLEANANISHEFLILSQAEKKEALMRFIDWTEDIRAIVFCRTKIHTQRLAESLHERSFDADALHGDMSQKQRDHVMAKFRNHKLRVLVATDVAARGIDVDDLTHIIHFNLPDDLANYTHRSGRTARAGKKGISLVMAMKSEMRKIKQLEKTLDISFKRIHIPNDHEIVDKRLLDWAEDLSQRKVSHNIDKELLDKLHDRLGQLEKTDLIDKLVDQQIHKMAIKPAGSRKRTESSDTRHTDSRSKPRTEDRKPREKKAPAEDSRIKQTRKQSDRFFINLGEIDGINKQDLLGFLCEYSELPGEQFRNIDLSRLHAFFEIDRDHRDLIVDKFSTLFVNGRKLRVNIDVDPDKRKSNQKKKKFK
jgi:ATP-dependent RNA helicase DeaD